MHTSTCCSVFYCLANTEVYNCLIMSLLATVGRELAGVYYYYYYDCIGQAAAADRALIYNKSLVNYGTHN